MKRKLRYSMSDFKSWSLVKPEKIFRYNFEQTKKQYIAYLEFFKVIHKKEKYDLMGFRNPTQLMSHIDDRYLTIMKANCIHDLNKSSWLSEDFQILSRNIRVQKDEFGLRNYWESLKDVRFNWTKRIILEMMEEKVPRDELEAIIPLNSLITNDINFGFLPSDVSARIREELSAFSSVESSHSVVSKSVPMGGDPGYRLRNRRK